jgi:hypothetical protein
VGQQVTPGAGGRLCHPLPGPPFMQQRVVHFPTVRQARVRGCDPARVHLDQRLKIKQKFRGLRTTKKMLREGRAKWEG